MEETTGTERAGGRRVGDAVVSVFAFAAFTCVSIFFAGMTSFLWLGPDRCFAPDPQMCAGEARALEVGGSLTLVALAALWILTLVRVVRRLRSGRSAFAISIISAGVAALVFVAAVVLISFFD